MTTEQTHTFTHAELISFVGRIVESQNLAVIEAIKDEAIIHESDFDKLNDLETLGITPHDCGEMIDNLLNSDDDPKDPDE